MVSLDEIVELIAFMGWGGGGGGEGKGWVVKPSLFGSVVDSCLFLFIMGDLSKTIMPVGECKWTNAKIHTTLIDNISFIMDLNYIRHVRYMHDT